MRSNDAIWGLTNDLFSFTLFQEVMLLELKKRDPMFENLELGTYYHTAGSLHLYERHFELAEKIIGAYEKREWIQAPMPPIPSLEQLWRLCEEERRLRKREIEQIDCKGFTDGCLWLASHLNMHRQKRDAEEARVEKKEAI
jgi:thymidylate synthase